MAIVTRMISDQLAVLPEAGQRTIFVDENGHLKLLDPTGGVIDVNAPASTLSVELFGIKALPDTDNTTDQTALIQNAINIVSATKGALFFPAGRYNFRGVPGGTAGAFTGINCSVFGEKGKTFLHNIGINGRNGRWDIVNRENIVFKDLTFIGDYLPENPGNQAAEYDILVRMTSCKFSAVVDCDFFNVYGGCVLMRHCEMSRMHNLTGTSVYKDTFHITGNSRYVTRSNCVVTDGGDDAFPVVGYKTGTGAGQPMYITDINCVVNGVKHARGFAYVGAAHVRNIGCMVNGKIPASLNPEAGRFAIAGLYISNEAAFDTYHNYDIVVDGIQIENCGSSSTAAIHIYSRPATVENGVLPMERITIRNASVANSANRAILIQGGSADNIKDVTIDNITIDDTTDPNGWVFSTPGSSTLPAIEAHNVTNLRINGSIRDVGSAAFIAPASVVIGGQTVVNYLKGDIDINVRTRRINKSGANTGIVTISQGLYAKGFSIEVAIEEQDRVASVGNPYFLAAPIWIGANAAGKCRKLIVNNEKDMGQRILTGGYTEKTPSLTTNVTGESTWTNVFTYPVMFFVNGTNVTSVQKAITDGVADGSEVWGTFALVNSYFMVNPGETIKIVYTGSASTITRAFRPTYC